MNMHFCSNEAVLSSPLNSFRLGASSQKDLTLTRSLDLLASTTSGERRVLKIELIISHPYAMVFGKLPGW